jgi:Terminase small subunit
MAGPLRNLKWEHFAREYASGESLAVAYVRAGFADTPNARFNASRLSNKPAVRERINELMEQFAEASALKIGYLQAQILPTLRTNPQDLFDKEGRLKPIRNLPREVAAAIKSIKFDKATGNVVEVVLADKISAANTLLRSIGAIREGEAKILMAVLDKRVSEWTAADIEMLESRLAAIDGGQPELELDNLPR